jgi:hypothetical protein
MNGQYSYLSYVIDISFADLQAINRDNGHRPEIHALFFGTKTILSIFSKMLQKRLTQN